MNRVAEQIRKEFLKVNSLISNTKKHHAGLLLSRENFQPARCHYSLSTRWFKWIKAVEYYSNNLETIEEIVQTFSDTNSAARVALVRGNCEGR
jgi:hypothetical protein